VMSERSLGCGARRPGTSHGEVAPVADAHQARPHRRRNCASHSPSRRDGAPRTNGKHVLAGLDTTRQVRDGSAGARTGDVTREARMKAGKLRFARPNVEWSPCGTAALGHRSPAPRGMDARCCNRARVRMRSVSSVAVMSSARLASGQITRAAASLGKHRP